MDPIHKAKLKRNYVQLVNDLEPKHVVDDLYGDGVLTENDCELATNTDKTRKERCQDLISVLMKRGPRAFKSFFGAIQNAGYSHIADLIRADTPTNVAIASRKNEKIFKSNGVCEMCSPYFPERFSNLEVGAIIKQHCCLILQNVEPKDLLPYNYQEELFSEDECERIKMKVTRKERCALYLKELSKCKKESLIELLKLSLQNKYQFIVDEIEKASLRAKSCTEVDSIHVQSSHLGENNLLAGISTSQNEVDSFTSFKDDIPDNTLHQLSLNVIKKRHSDSRNADIEKEHVVTSCAVRKERKQYVKRRRGYPTGSSTDDCPSPKRLARPRTCSKEDQLVSTISTGHILISPGSSKPDNLPNKRLDVAFNTLVTLMNRGLFDEFNSLNNRLRRQCKIDFDMRCVLGYLQANLELHKSNFDGAKQQIESAITICHKTTNPRYLTLELLGTKARMLLYQKKFEKLQEVVDDARMLIETDIVAASGRAAGWLHVQEGRLMASQIDLLNPTRVNFAGAHHLLHKRAKVSFEKALANFQKDKSEYGPVGYVYTMCRLIILLLQCGENGLAMDILRPDPSEIESSGKYLLQVAGSSVTSRKVLNMHYHLASSDYYFRSENMTKAFECAELAHDLAKQLAMNEFMVHAYNRLVFLKAQVLPFSKEIVDTGTCDILFGSSSCQVISCDDVEISDKDLSGFN